MDYSTRSPDPQKPDSDAGNSLLLASLAPIIVLGISIASDVRYISAFATMPKDASGEHPQDGS